MNTSLVKELTSPEDFDARLKKYIQNYRNQIKNMNKNYLLEAVAVRPELLKESDWLSDISISDSENEDLWLDSSWFVSFSIDSWFFIAWDIAGPVFSFATSHNSNA